MRELDTYGWVALIITLVGGINWGLVGLVDLNLIGAIFPGFLGRLAYLVIGVAAGYLCYLIYIDKYKKTAPPTTPTT